VRIAVPANPSRLSFQPAKRKPGRGFLKKRSHQRHREDEEDEGIRRRPSHHHEFRREFHPIIGANAGVDEAEHRSRSDPSRNVTLGGGWLQSDVSGRVPPTKHRKQGDDEQRGGSGDQREDARISPSLACSSIVTSLGGTKPGRRGKRPLETARRFPSRPHPTRSWPRKPHGRTSVSEAEGQGPAVQFPEASAWPRRRRWVAGDISHVGPGGGIGGGMRECAGVISPCLRSSRRKGRGQGPCRTGRCSLAAEAASTTSSGVPYREEVLDPVHRHTTVTGHRQVLLARGFQSGSRRADQAEEVPNGVLDVLWIDGAMQFGTR